MKNYVITIGRQYGCGAREIGSKLAKRLNIPYYDKELIKLAAKESGFDENIFCLYDERATRSYLYNLSTDGFAAISGNSTTLEDQVFQYQFDTIRKVADEGSCIIVGRCADYILKDNPNMLSIFLHADDEYRHKRIVQEYGIDKKSAAKEMKSIDKKRMRFHNFYSEEKWGDAKTYDLTINVSKLGVDQTVDLIEAYINNHFK